MNQVETAGLISIIMPVYNGEKYIASAIESVLGQAYENWELIVVDDCSKDSTAEIIEVFTDSRIKYTKNKANSGCAVSRNNGLDIASGEYVAFLDCDDIWHEDKLAKQVQLIKNTDVDLVYTGYQFIDQNDVKTKVIIPKGKATLSDLLKENYIIFSTVLCKRSILKGIGFKPEWFHEDYVYLLDLLQKKARFAGLQEKLALYRVHKGGRSNDKKNAALRRWDIYRNYLHYGYLKSLYYFAFYAYYGARKYK